MRNLVFWALIPFLIPQAIRVRNTALRFAVAAGPSEGKVGSGRQLRLLAIGDSIIAGVGASELSRALVGQTSARLAELLNCQISWATLGRLGINSKTVLQDLIPMLPTDEADIFVVSVGVNDVTALTTLPNWRKNLTDLLLALSQHSPNAVIAAAGIPPLSEFPVFPQPLRTMVGWRGQSLNLVAREVVSEFSQAIHVPVEFDSQPERFAADGFHPSEPGYEEYGLFMARAIADGLRRRT